MLTVVMEAQATLNVVAEIRFAGFRLGNFHNCFVAGTLVATSNGDIRIEDLRVGDGVEAGSPECADDHFATDTITIDLELPNPHEADGVFLVKLARPRSWLDAHI